MTQQAAPVAGRVGTASFTGDLALRWRLDRMWVRPPGDSRLLRGMTWIMLNPSVAGAGRNDATVTRCLGYADREGCARLTVVNLFPAVATQPVTLLPFGGTLNPWWEECNDRHITAAVTEQAPGMAAEPLVVCGWGTWGGHPSLEWRAARVVRLLGKLRVPWFALGWTANGQPTHPVRQRGDAKLLEYRP